MLDESGAAVKGLGKGGFALDFDAAQALPGHDATVGALSYSYERPALDLPLELDAHFHAVKFNADSTARFDAEFALHATPGASGHVSVTGWQVAGDKPGSLSLLSAWDATTAGRSDWTLDTAGEVFPSRGTECWDASQSSVYEVVSDHPEQDHGLLAACALQLPTASVAP